MPLINPPLRQCLPAAKPAVTCVPSQLYGIPAQTAGRNGQIIRGIVIHCIDEAEGEACGSVPKLNRLRGGKNSLHYGISLNGGIKQFVDDGDIAYGLDFNVPLGTTTPVYACPGSECNTIDNCGNVTVTPGTAVYKPLWALSDLAAVANVPFDYYLLHIGIENAGRKASAQTGQILPDDPCGPCNGNDLRVQFTREEMASLVQLVAYLSETYTVPLDADHINFWHQIDPCQRDECGCDPCITQFLCKVGSYCQGPKVVADQTYVVGTGIDFVYGENEFGQKTAEKVSDFIAGNFRKNTATGNIEYFRASDGTWQVLPSV